MRAKSMILLALSLGCGLVAALGINQVLASRKTPVIASGETEPIFVATKDIGIGDPINLQMVKLEPWPKDKVPPGAILKTPDLEGRRPKQKIYAGEPVLEAKLLAKGDAGTGATDLIPIGFRVVPVRVDSMTSADLIRPGDRVDLLVHLSENGGVAKTMTVTFLRFIKVFAIDQQYTPNDVGDQAAAAVKTVSLLVKPDQAELVTLAQSMGKINLVMRSPMDDDIEGTSSADIQELIAGQASGNDENSPGSGNGFLDFLQGKAPPAPTPTPAPIQSPLTSILPVEPVEQPWRMTIWDGDKPRELEILDGKVNQAAPPGTAPGATGPATTEPVGVTPDATAPAPDAHQDGGNSPTNNEPVDPSRDPSENTGSS